MVDVSMRVRGRDQAQEATPNPRGERRQRRMQVLKEARAGHASVRVIPQEKYRHVLKHPSNGIGFRKEGGATWPNDRFTQRRLRDGSVTLEPAKEEKKDEPKRSTSTSASTSSTT